ncbi:unnamed protein product (macronuclear) [Paramecium tetraurelia]|uniref:Transmembrane protein n=1 Tax=Paramecium tetraurelia TaxID=5888 RepID=A0DDS5_PARTE|nr:uncharacterized protein GSPATT00016033001 [Paramecium tetraurelia]CAK81192.1 unnamed protein product [Paramecium tetraurelia]|eukprot:XP_001448589.1 hypothetical protein (macronuclear) [Paramecium tetraurelia strain d4-2]
MTKVQFLLTYMIVLAHSCSYLYNNTIFLTGTLQEVINVPLSSIFHTDYFERLTLKQTDKFLSITSPISKYSEKYYGGIKDLKIVTQKLQKSTSSRDPINHLTILGVNYDTYYAQSNQGTYLDLPQISILTNCEAKKNSICYDIVQIDRLTVIDCDDQKKNSYFILMNQDSTTYLDVDKATSEFRKIDQVDKYMFRGTADKIFVYIEEEGQLKYLISLDETTLIALLEKDSFKLSIKDFQVHTNGQLSILNASGEIIIVQYKNDSWGLIKIIETHINDVQGYDYNIYTNTYAIISKTQIVFQNRDKEKQLAEILNEDASSKIYLTKRNILLFQNNTVTLLNESLKKIQNLKFDNELAFINTNQNAEGFMIVSNIRVAGFTINENYSLKLSLTSAIVGEGYQQASLIQGAYPQNCQITLFYKTQDLGYKQILQSQYSQGLLVGGVNIDSDIIKLVPIYQGSDLKYQFKANNLIKKIEIEKHQAFSLQGLSETQTLGYRKILKANGQWSYYVIQQDANLQVKGYLCEGNLQLNCNLLFTKDQFKQLQNSLEQLWWSNQESLFFGTFQEQSITIYYLSTQTNNLDILTTIEMGSNVKQIVTDGSHLFVLLEQEIRIYEITILNQAKLTNTFNVFAKKIYASEHVKNLFFIEQQFSLNLYDIEYDLQTIVWYGTIQFDYQESNLAIFENHFVRFIKPDNEENYIVTVFNYANKRNIYTEKQISFTHYTDINLSTLECSFDRNLFYIHGYNKQSSSQVILVYKLTSNSLDTLFYQINSTPSTIFSVAGNNILMTDIVNKQVVNYQITGELVVTSVVNKEYEQIPYTSLIQLDFDVTNDLSNKMVASIAINSVNRGSKIILRSDQINLNYTKHNDTVNCADLGQDWYSGQVFDIELADQQKKIQLNPSLTLQKEILEYSPQLKQFNSSRLVQLMQNKLNLVNIEEFTFQILKLDEDYQFTAILLIAGENIYVQAKSKESIWLRVIQCKNSDMCNLLDNKFQLSMGVKRAYLHENNFFLYMGNYVNVYDTLGDATKLEQFELIQSFSQYYQLQQMEFTHLQKNVYQFISVDIWGNPEFQMREINRTATNNYLVKFPLDSLLAGQKINKQEIQQSAGFVLTKNQITIIFKNSASYSFHYEINCSRNELCEISTFKFNGLYQQYQDWQLIDFSQNENILQLIYLTQTHYELMLYDMETPSSNSKPKNVIAHLATPLSGIKDNSQHLSFVYSLKDKLHLLASSEGQLKLQHYILLRSPQLCTSEIKFEDQVKFKLSNTDENVSIQEKVIISEYIPPSPPDNDDNGSFPIWAIILILLGVLLIGGGIFLYCRQRKNKNQNTNLLLES